ncbi:MAG: TIGR01777 family oxidoreductase [Bacteroidetes bacterium]|nr:TIGR01777 family oxidoreductase [Bacteroidota bacterium]
MNKVLITGADGLIGTRLQQLLKKDGYAVHTIGRAKKDKPEPDQYIWDIATQTMDPASLKGVTAIIHLAGAGVADQRWTAARKKEIYDSRIDSTRLIYKTLATIPNQVKTIVSAAAVGYYGDRGADVISETEPPGDSFLAKVVLDWEREVAQMEKLSVRHICCRIGVVLARHGGALPELDRTVPAGIAPYFAKQDLYYPWVHIDDVCGTMIHALEQEAMHGSYNTTAPEPVQIKALMRAIITARRAHALLVPVPPLALKVMLGEMSEVVLQSQRCSDAKLLASGYQFKYPDLAGALKDIYKKG